MSSVCIYNRAIGAAGLSLLILGRGPKPINVISQIYDLVLTERGTNKVKTEYSKMSVGKLMKSDRSLLYNSNGPFIGIIIN